MDEPKKVMITYNLKRKEYKLIKKAKIKGKKRWPRASQPALKSIRRLAIKRIEMGDEAYVVTLFHHDAQ